MPLASVLGDIADSYEGITLSVDEANIALTIREHTSATKIEATLAVFTKLTKEQKKASHFR